MHLTRALLPSSLLGAARRRLGSERGFTLVETLVAMVTGVIVTGALFAILEVSLHQTSRLTDRIQANQLGRTTMTKITDELRSGCIAPNFAPIQEGSGSSELIFIDGVGKEPVLGEEKPAEHVFKHKIKYESATGRIIDETFAANGGTWPNYTFPASATKAVRIGENISQTGTGAIFTYYFYATKTTSGGEQAVTSLEPVPPGELPLKEANKNGNPKKIGSVQIAYTAGATSGNKALNRSVEMSNQVTFAFSIPSAETPIEQGPCE